MSTSRKLFLLACLYCAQGLPYGFFTQALPVIMRRQKVELHIIGLTSLLALPWALKFLWAPFVERTYSQKIGKRKSWILPLQGCTLLFLVGLSFFPPAGNDFTLIAMGFLFANFFAATQDIATDGLAVELLEKHERGLGNGIQVSGYRIGMILGGGLLLILLGRFGWQVAFLTMGMILLMVSLPALFFQETKLPTNMKEGPPQTKAQEGQQKKLILSFVKQAHILPWLLILFVYKAGEHFATGMLRPLLTDWKYTFEQIGIMLGLAGFTAGLLGALVGGLFINKLGRKRALFSFGLLQALAVGLYLLPFYGWKDFNSLLIFLSIEHFVSGMATVALFTIMMDWCRSGSEGSDYTVQASIVVVASGLAASLSGLSAKAFGYKYHFLFATILTFIAPLLVALFYKKPQQDKIGS